MNNHIYSTLYKRLERKSDRRSKETEQRKNHKTHTHKKYIYLKKYIKIFFLNNQKIKNKNKKTTEHVTSIYCTNIKLSSSLSGLEKYNVSPHWLSSSSSAHLSPVPHHAHAITAAHCVSTPTLAEPRTGVVSPCNL